MDKRRLRSGWYFLGGLLLAALGWFGLPPLLRHTEFFRVRRVEVRGLRNLAAAEVVKALKIPPGASVFDDPGELVARARTVPGLTDVEVRRRLPGTLRVTVQEAAPVAFVPRVRRLAMVDEAGTVLPFDATLSAPDLPVIREPDSVVTRLLARVRDVDATLFGWVLTGWRAGPDVILQVNGQRYWFRPDAPVEVIRAVTAVAQDLARKGRRYDELDARFQGQVVVRRGVG